MLKFNEKMGKNEATRKCHIVVRAKRLAGNLGGAQ